MEASINLWRSRCKPVSEMGPAVLQLTSGPLEYKHSYYLFSPWSADDRHIVLLRYDRQNPEAEICVLDAGSDAMRVVGKTRRWNSHTAARQQWLDACGRIYYHKGRDEQGRMLVSMVAPDGSEEETYAVAGLDASAACSADGRFLYTVTPVRDMFPDDRIAERADKGLWRVNIATGERELLLSVKQVVSMLPDAEEVEQYHLHLKSIILHARQPRVLMHLVNTFWDRGAGEPRIRRVFSVGTDGSNPVYIGHSGHHLNWHPTEDRLSCNVPDINGKLRLGIYRGDGSGLLYYVPDRRGSGHPSISPDGRWICTDGAGGRLGSSTILCDWKTGERHIAAEYGRRPGATVGGYASFEAIQRRAEGETIVAALGRSGGFKGETWMTQAHPAWNRDGSAVMINWDWGEGSQVYMLDVQRAITGSAPG